MDATTTLLFGIPLLILIPLALAFIGLKLGIKRCKTKPTNFKEILFVMWALSYVADLIVIYLIVYTPISYSFLSIGPIGVLIGLIIPFVLIFFLDYIFLTRVFSFGKGDASRVSILAGILTNALVLFFILFLILAFIDEAGGFYKNRPNRAVFSSQSENNALCRTASCATNAHCTVGTTPDRVACQRFSAGTCVGVQKIGGTTVSGTCQPNATAIYTATGTATWT